MIGIGTYVSHSDLKHLVGTANEYKRMIKLFVQHWGYSFLYQTDDNKIICLNNHQLKQNHNKYHSNFKLKWNYREIEEFLEDSHVRIEAIKPDGLIFIVSGHGGRDKPSKDDLRHSKCKCEKCRCTEGFGAPVLSCSNGTTYAIENIKGAYYNTAIGCPWLADKPKIFFFDICTGKASPQPPRLKLEKKMDIDATYTTRGKKNDNNNNSNNTSVKPTRIRKTQISEQHLQHENFCVAFANLDGYSATDGNEKGNLL